MTTERMLGGFTRTEWLTFLGIASADDPKLAALAATSWGGNALKVLQVNATENGWQFAAIVGLTDGDKGDITVSSGGMAWAIDNGAVSLVKQADVATATVFYRKTAGTGSPEVQTLATLKTDLGLTGTNSGDQASIVGITGTLAQFNTAVTDADLAPTASPTFTGTMGAAAANFSGNVTLGDATGDAHTVNGHVSISVGNNSSSGVSVTDVSGKSVRLTASDGGIALPGVGSYTANDFVLFRNATRIATVTAAAFNLASGIVYQVNGTQVVTSRRTGWGAPTGTATRTAFDTGTVTLPQLAERLKALIDDATTHGLIGA